MNTYAEMSARHAVALEVLAGFVATATEGAFQRLMRAELPADRDQAAVVFDRMGRGLRLTVALEARMARDRRRDDREIARWEAEDAAAPEPACRPQRPDLRPDLRVGRTRASEEADHESEGDCESADASLGLQLQALTDLLDEQAAALDPEHVHRDGLARLTNWWVKSQDAANPKPRRRRPRSDRPRADSTVKAFAGPDPPWQGSG